MELVARPSWVMVIVVATVAFELQNISIGNQSSSSQNNHHCWNYFSNQHTYMNWSIQSCRCCWIEVICWESILSSDECLWSFLFTLISQISDHCRSNIHRLKIVICLLLLHLSTHSFYNSTIYECMKKNNWFHQLIKENEILKTQSENLNFHRKYNATHSSPILREIQRLFSPI